MWLRKIIEIKHDESPLKICGQEITTLVQERFNDYWVPIQHILSQFRFDKFRYDFGEQSSAKKKNNNNNNKTIQHERK